MTTDLVNEFQTNGFVILRQVLDGALCSALLTAARAELRAATGLVEYEAELGYAGSPASLDAEGGNTIRRLRDVYARQPVFQKWAEHPLILETMRQILGARLMLVRTHHNCLMTKHPCFGSSTEWHRDIRYWSFERHELVSSWLALGEETPANGGLQVLPGSHRWALDAAHLDDRQFLKVDAARAHGFVIEPQAVCLQPGDVLLFHAKTLHAAGRNTTDTIKFSLVYTYRNHATQPVPGSRSAQGVDIALPARSPTTPASAGNSTSAPSMLTKNMNASSKPISA